jgi:hypothetical protein
MWWSGCTFKHAVANGPRSQDQGPDGETLPEVKEGRIMGSKKRTRTIVVAVIGISLIAIPGMLAQGPNNQRPKTATSAVPKAASPAATAAARTNIDRSPAMQQKRSKLIAELIADGVFAKVKTNVRDYPDVYVTSRFIEGNFDDKERLISVVYARYVEGKGYVGVYDARTNKEIGRYFADSGLKLN